MKAVLDKARAWVAARPFWAVGGAFGAGVFAVLIFL